MFFYLLLSFEKGLFASAPTPEGLHFIEVIVEGTKPSKDDLNDHDYFIVSLAEGDEDYVTKWLKEWENSAEYCAANDIEEDVFYEQSILAAVESKKPTLIPVIDRWFRKDWLSKEPFSVFFKQRHYQSIPIGQRAYLALIEKTQGREIPLLFDREIPIDAKVYNRLVNL